MINHVQQKLRELLDTLTGVSAIDREEFSEKFKMTLEEIDLLKKQILEITESRKMDASEVLRFKEERIQLLHEIETLTKESQALSARNKELAEQLRQALEKMAGKTITTESGSTLTRLPSGDGSDHLFPTVEMKPKEQEEVSEEDQKIIQEIREKTGLPPQRFQDKKPRGSGPGKK